MIKLIKKTLLKNFIKGLNNANYRDEFVKHELKKINDDKIILDAGCGSQPYKKYCSHLKYKSQDFGLYKSDLKKSFFSSENEYDYGELDYVSNIWDIKEKDNYFDAVLCTEVFEHIPYPIETVKEFSRLLKKGGKLILTAPSNSLRHFDPYFYYPGFSDNWFKKILSQNHFEIKSISPVGDYYSFLKVEIARTMAHHSFFSKIILLPALIYFSNKRKTKDSINTLCMGYHVVAEKL
jgi:SAM-dependent methyltransferase